MKITNDEVKRIIGELDIHKLEKNLDQTEYGPVPVAIGDLFAVGCYFIHAGKEILGQKLCHTALAAYNIDRALVDKIIESIDDNEHEMANLLNPHCEIPSWLFEDGIDTILGRL
ncbi:MAG: hypothetical protein HPY74_18280 [Firmicutes bacterium]|nr:hypothetical protein [Bacillota bacterium]